MKSYSGGFELSMASHSSQASNSTESLDIVKCSAAPQLRNPIRTSRSGEAMSEESAYLMTSSFDAGGGGVNDRGSVVIGGLDYGKTHVIL